MKLHGWDEPTKNEKVHLGEGLVALRTRGGKVPQGCLGAVLGTDGVLRYSLAGRKLQPAKGEIGYFFHPGPYRIEFAPDVAAPEAGVRLSVQLQFGAGENPNDAFVRYLAERDLEELSLDALREELELTQIEIPPCVQRAELDTLRARLSYAWQARMGFCCIGLDRIDLGDRIDTAKVMCLNPEVVNSQKAVRSIDLSSSRETESDRAQIQAHRRPRSWHRQNLTGIEVERHWRTAETSLVRRLFTELPRFVSALRDSQMCLSGEAFQDCRGLVQRAQNLAGMVNGLPNLEAKFSSLLPEGEQRLLVAETHRASANLDEAWGLVNELGMHNNTAWPVYYDNLDRVIANMEAALARRQQV